MKSSLSLIFVSSLFLIGSCGSGGENPSPGLQGTGPNFLPSDGSNISGLYMAKFITINSHLNGIIPGSATLRRNNDDFYAYVRLFSAGPGTWHPQYIHIGGRCPTLEDDQNNDGIIDVQEGRMAWGDILIPLDNNLSTQIAGKNIFPLGDEAGSYFYEKKTSFTKMFNDLKEEDTDFNDFMTKLGPNEGLTFEGKAVVILGVDEWTYLPNTVRSMGSLPPHKTVPIACGILEKVQRVPGESDDGIPGPVGPVTPGEGRPAPDNNPLPDEGTGRRPGYSPDGERTIIDWWLEHWRRWRGNRRDRMGDDNGRRFWESN